MDISKEVIKKLDEHFDFTSAYLVGGGCRRLVSITVVPSSINRIFWFDGENKTIAYTPNLFARFCFLLFGKTSGIYQVVCKEWRKKQKALRKSYYFSSESRAKEWLDSNLLAKYKKLSEKEAFSVAERILQYEAKSRLYK